MAGNVQSKTKPRYIYAHKECDINGSWYKHPETQKPWSNYTTCVDQEDLSVRITINQIYETGYLISLVALLASLAIYTYFKSLRCCRTTLHIHLFVSFAVNNALWLIWYRFVLGDPDVIKENGVGCRIFHVILHYFLMTNYSWMLCEGLYLHTLLVNAFLSEERLVKWLYVLGWAIPAVAIIIYSVLRASGQREEITHCWMNETKYTNVLVVPVFISMVLNLVFLCNIVRVLMTKLRAGPHVGSQRPSRTLLQAFRATLLLVPLLGLHYLLTPFRPDKGHSWEFFYEVLSAITASLQGLCVATLFCFCNGEVHAQLKRQLTYWKDLLELVAETDLEALVPELLKRGVFNEQIIRRILNPSHGLKQKKTDLYLEILKRGPGAFAKLRDSLNSTNHSNLVSILDMQNENHFHRSSSLNSVGSLGSPPRITSSDDNDEPCYSSAKEISEKQERAVKPHVFPQPFLTNSNPSCAARLQVNPTTGASSVPSLSGFSGLTLHQRRRVFADPIYYTTAGSGGDKEISTPNNDYSELFSDKRNLPVNVKQSEDWPVLGSDELELYKMDSNPRGWALLINNISFYDSEQYPNRSGAENDDTRLKSLLEQLHFKVENYRNKTKEQMEEIVVAFSQKEDVVKGDCIWVTLMSHGEEGQTPEDTQVLGVDGIGYGVDDIVSNFYNDVSPGASNKPKIFAIQACRGNMIDVGVSFSQDIWRRTESDGKRVALPREPKRQRTYSDIYICFSTAPGIQANRDRETGGWFVQAIVDVFSEHACNTSLDDLMKLVDKRLQKKNAVVSGNFQSVSIKLTGWSKNLYFNPGLCKNQKTGETIRIETSQECKGIDSVDLPETYSEKNPGGLAYLRLKDGKSEDSNDDGRHSCCNAFGCNPI